MSKFIAKDVPPRSGVLKVQPVRDGLEFIVEHVDFGWRFVTISSEDVNRLRAWLNTQVS